MQTCQSWGPWASCHRSCQCPGNHSGEREKRSSLGRKANSKALAVLRARAVGEGGGFTKGLVRVLGPFCVRRPLELNSD